MTDLTWSDVRVEMLKNLWETGLSARKIAIELGGFPDSPDNGRNAVIGKARRLGLPGRPNSPTSAAPRQRKARPAAQPMMRIPQPPKRPASALSDIFDIEELPETAGYDTEIPVGQRASLCELNDAVCHWPVGDPASAEFFFCGGKSLQSLPYCAHHSRIAYKPASNRRASQKPSYR